MYWFKELSPSMRAELPQTKVWGDIAQETGLITQPKGYINPDWGLGLNPAQYKKWLFLL